MTITTGVFKMKKANAMITFLTGCLLYSIAGMATTLPDYYPPAFRVWGVLDRLDIAGGMAVINDTQMTISANVHVYTPSSRFASVHALQPGSKVGISMSGGGNQPPMITDIWVLPDDYSQRLR
jgi:hypothetical protein